MKKRLIVRLVLFILTFFAFFGATTFAWMSFTRESNPIIIKSGSFGLSAVAYFANDDNFDGIFNESDYEKILSAGKVFERVIPGQIYSFKIVMENLGTIPGNLKLELNSASANHEIARHLVLSYTHNENNYERNLSYNDQTDYLNSDSTIGMKLFDMYRVEELTNEEGNTQFRYIFEFNVKVMGTLGAAYFNQSYILDYFKITLDQIQN